MFRILGIGMLTLGLATSAQAQQTQGDSGAPHQPILKMTPNADSTTIKSPPAETTVDPGTTGSTANGDSGMPNSNGDSQGCNGTASGSAGSQKGQSASNAPGANCQ